MARVDPPYAADERTMLLAWLEFQRESILIKLDGLDEEQARWTPAPTANSLLSITKHLGWVEQWWFATVLLGEPDEWPRDDDDADFRVGAVGSEETVTSVGAFYRARWERSNEITLAASSLDQVAVHEHPRLQGVTLRWILVHMIEETARHAGHADITRELIDGSVGV